MALTLSKITNAGRSIDGVPGANRVVYRDVTFDNSYATGGLSLTPASLGLKAIFHVRPDGPAINAAGTSALGVKYNYATQKLQAYRYDGASAGKAFLEEVAAAVDLSTFTVRLAIEGRVAT